MHLLKNPEGANWRCVVTDYYERSSEREYRLPTAEIEKFIKWYDRTVGTGNTCYLSDDIVDLSKEYLSFEKIISFKVIPLTK